MEALVALVLVQFGLLAVAAASGIAARDVAAAARISRARDAAQQRVEQLRPGACHTTVEGTMTTVAWDEHWSVQGDSLVRVVRDSVEYRLPGGKTGRIVVEYALLCA